MLRRTQARRCVGLLSAKKAYPHVFAHYAKVTSDERIKALFGQPTFIDKPLSVEYSWLLACNCIALFECICLEQAMILRQRRSSMMIFPHQRSQSADGV